MLWIFSLLVFLLESCPTTCKIPVHGTEQQDVNNGRQSLPENFSWGDMNGQNLLTAPLNEMACNASWALATVGALSDRLKIAMQHRAHAEVLLAAQVLINCVGACGQGSPEEALAYVHSNGIPDETCQNFMAMNGTCSAGVPGSPPGSGVCETCDSGKTFWPGICSAVSENRFLQYKIQSFGKVGSADKSLATQVTAMASEIFNSGPIICRWRSRSTEQGQLIQRFVSVVGWSGIPGNSGSTWIIRGTHGTQWRDAGYANVSMRADGTQTLDECWWGSFPKETLESRISGDDLADQHLWTRELTSNNIQRSTHACAWPHAMLPSSRMRRRPSIQRHEWKEIPNSYDIRNVSGLNFAASDLNQFIPNFCGSCWAVGVVNALTDRFRLKLRTNLRLSHQEIVNCANESSTGTYAHGCYGGYPVAAIEYIAKFGIVDFSCTNYVAADLQCNASNLCSLCEEPGQPCVAIRPKRYLIQDYGHVNGTEEMQQEILAGGPISCGILVTDQFVAYQGGIYREPSNITETNHQIEIAGWGVADGVKYWIGRNSYGTTWGENGWFRIVRGENNAGIESDCIWATPGVKQHVASDLDDQAKVFV